MAKKSKEGVSVEQLKDGRWALRVDGNILLEATRKETIEFQLPKYHNREIAHVGVLT